MGFPQSITFSESKAERPIIELQSALDLESFWRANLHLLETVLPHHSCSLMVHIVDYQPLEARHHVEVDRGGVGGEPVTSLSIAQPYLVAHPQVKLYTYSEIVKEDPRASIRRLERERYFWGWNQFVHLAFWDGPRPDAVLSIRRTVDQGDFTPEDKEFLSRLHPMIDAGLHRLRALERERGRTAGMERFLAGLPLPVLFLEDDGKLGFATQDAYDLCAAWNFGFKEARSLSTRRCFNVPPEILAACTRLAAVRDYAAARGDVAGLESERVAHPQIPHLIAKVDVSQPIRGPYVRPGYWVTFASDRNLDGANVELTSEALGLLQFLTPSERRVALLVAEGCRNQDVAEKLGKSLRTVEHQLNSIYKKLNVTCRTELSRLLS